MRPLVRARVFKSPSGRWCYQALAWNRVFMPSPCVDWWEAMGRARRMVREMNDLPHLFGGSSR